MNVLNAFYLLAFILFSSVLTAQSKGNSELIPASKALYEDYLNKYEVSGSSMKTHILKKLTDELKNSTKRYINATGKDEPLDEFSWACEVVKGDGKEKNVLVMPGGKILFFSEMFSIANTENKLAWFLSHGLAHTLIDEGENNTIQTFGEKGEGFTNLEELLADQLGAKIMAIAGYDPQAGVDIWEDLQDMEEVEYLKYHPSYEDKLPSLKTFALDAKEVAKSYGTVSFR